MDKLSISVLAIFISSFFHFGYSDDRIIGLKCALEIALEGLVNQFVLIITEERLNYVETTFLHQLSDKEKSYAITSFEEFQNLHLESDKSSLVMLLSDDLQKIEAYFKEALQARRSQLDYHLIPLASDELLDKLETGIAEKFLHITGLVLSQKASEYAIVLKGFGNQHHHGHRRFQTFNLWNEKQGFLREKYFFTSMNAYDFNGHVFKVVAMKNQFFVKQNEDGRYYGSEIDKFNILMQKMNFGMNLTESVDGKFGAVDAKTGEWNGAISMIIKEDVDWSLGGYIVNYPRTTVIDFARIPFCMIATGLNFLTLPPGEKPLWPTVLYPFDQILWLFILATIILFPMISWFILRGPRQEHVNFITMIDWMSNMVVSRGEKNPLAPSSPTMTIIMISWCIFGTIITFSYSSCLITSLTFRQKERPLETWRDVLNSDYLISFAYGTNEQVRIETASKEFAPLYYAMAQRVAQQDKSLTYLPFNPILVQEHIQKHPKTIFIMTLFEIFPSLFPFDEQGNQVLYLAKEKDYAYYISLPFQRNFVYLPLFNKYFDRLFETGVDMKLLRDATAGQKLLSLSDKELKVKVVLLLEHLQGPFVFLLFGLGISTLAFLAETWIGRVKGHQ